MTIKQSFITAAAATCLCAALYPFAKSEWDQYIHDMEQPQCHVLDSRPHESAAPAVPTQIAPKPIVPTTIPESSTSTAPVNSPSTPYTWELVGGEWQYVKSEIADLHNKQCMSDACANAAWSINITASLENEIDQFRREHINDLCGNKPCASFDFVAAFRGLLSLRKLISNYAPQQNEGNDVISISVTRYGEAEPYTIFFPIRVTDNTSRGTTSFFNTASPP